MTPPPSTEQQKPEQDDVVLVLSIGLGVVSFMVVSLLFVVCIWTCNNRRGHHPNPNPNPNPAKDNNKAQDARLRKLDAVAPVATLEGWLANVKGRPLPLQAESGDDSHGNAGFICVICLDQVQRTQEVHDLKCLHVFHRECFERWFLGHHFTCPLCHRVYFVDEEREREDFVWMV